MLTSQGPDPVTRTLPANVPVLLRVKDGSGCGQAEAGQGPPGVRELFLGRQRGGEEPVCELRLQGPGGSSPAPWSFPYKIIQR